MAQKLPRKSKYWILEIEKELGKQLIPGRDKSTLYKSR